jgi:hypothetical protein
LCLRNAGPRKRSYDLLIEWIDGGKGPLVGSFPELVVDEQLVLSHE